MENTPSSNPGSPALSTTESPVAVAIKCNDLETHQAESATTSQSQPLVGTTPEHAAVMAALNMSVPPKVIFHERLQFGSELVLAPLTGTEKIINLVLTDGDAKLCYLVHTDLLCYYSPYFHKTLNTGAVTAKALVLSKMLRREWRWERASDIENMEGNGYGDVEGKVQVDVRIKLPGAGVRNFDLNKEEVGDVGPRSVGAFVDWLYRGFPGLTWDGHGHMKYSSTELIKLWVFAGKIGVPACQNHCIEGIEMLRYQTGDISTGMLRWVYDNTAGMRGHEKLKMLLLDQCAWKLHGMYVINGGLGGDLGVPREAINAILGRTLLMLQSHVNINTDAPPFAMLEWRKHLYWIEDDGSENDGSEDDGNEDDSAPPNEVVD